MLCSALLLLLLPRASSVRQASRLLVNRWRLRVRIESNLLINSSGSSNRALWQTFRTFALTQQTNQMQFVSPLTARCWQCKSSLGSIDNCKSRRNTSTSLSPTQPTGGGTATCALTWPLSMRCRALAIASAEQRKPPSARRIWQAHGKFAERSTSETLSRLSAFC